MKYFLLSLTLFVCFSSLELLSQKNYAPLMFLSDPPNPLEYREQAFDILHYDLDAHFDNIPLKSIKARNKITFVWTKVPTNEKFYFHLRDLLIDTIRYNQNLASYSEIGTKADAEYHFEVLAPQEAQIGDTVVLEIQYHGIMTAEPGTSSWGGVQSSSGSFYALGVGFKNNYVSTTQHWLPCFDHPSDKATFKGKFRAKSPFFVASIGTLTIENPTDTVPEYVWEHPYPVATYLLTFAVDNFIPISYETQKPSIVYTKKIDSVQTQYAFAQLPTMVECFESLFKPYPFEKIGFCITQLGAMEHQTMISYPRSLIFSTFNKKDSMNPVAAHELAHMWFGDLVTPYDFSHAWLTESFATLSEALWFEYKQGKQSYLNYQEKQANDYINSYSISEGIFPIYNFDRTGKSSNYPRTIYEKGAVVLGMLRYHLGDELFFEALDDYLTVFAYKNAKTEDVLSIFKSKSTKNIEPFFNEWIYGKGYPELVIDTVRNTDDSFTLNIRQVQQAEWGVYTSLPINVSYLVGDEQIGDTVLILNQKNQIFTLPLIQKNTILQFNKGTKVRSLFKVKEITTNVNYDSKENEFQIVPNPSSNYFTLINPKNIEFHTVEIYNVLGTLESKIENIVTNTYITIPISNLVKGVYIVVLKGNSQSYVKKLAVQL